MSTCLGPVQVQAVSVDSAPLRYSAAFVDGKSVPLDVPDSGEVRADDLVRVESDAQGVRVIVVRAPWNRCPKCGQIADATDVHDGSEIRCLGCRAWCVVVELDGGGWRLDGVELEPSSEVPPMSACPCRGPRASCPLCAPARDSIARVSVADDAPALFETRAPGVCDRVLIGGVEFPPPAGRFNTLLAEAAKGILVTTFANMDRARMLDLLPYPRIEEHALDRWEGEGGAS